MSVPLIESDRFSESLNRRLLAEGILGIRARESVGREDSIADLPATDVGADFLDCTSAVLARSKGKSRRSTASLSRSDIGLHRIDTNRENLHQNLVL